MNGQWLGTFGGTNSGIMMLDADDQGDFVDGHAYIFDDDPTLPAFVTYFRTKDRNPKQTLTLRLNCLRPDTLDLIPWERVRELFPNLMLPQTADAELVLQKRALKVRWSTPIGTNGSASLPRSKATKKSVYKGNRKVSNWEKFKNFATSLEPGRFIFRGQSKPFRLRTAFHRTKRKDLVRFIDNDIPSLHRQLSVRTKHLFNLADPLQNGAFWNLIQHHGYPTPLLDWTRSPFVAAFFAYNAARSIELSPGEKVRIFMFDSKEWKTDFNQLQRVHFTRPHFSLLETLPIENERALPQQALSSITNIDDIETYIAGRESEQNKCYLFAFDLPYVESENVLRELRLMGITAGSLFPGFDGTCDELRTQNFG